MRTLLIILAATTALAQTARQTQQSHTSESLRGVSAVSQNVAWASGTHGTYLRTTDAGRTWIPAQVPDAATLDFRAAVAFSADEAFLMSAGLGDQSRIYHTADAGQHWQLQFSNPNPKGFFDSMVFWDHTHGIVLGDPILDESGQLKFELLTTTDGHTWTHIPPAQLPPAIEGEGAFAASNTSLAILPNPVILRGDMHSAKRSACRSRKPALSLPKGTPCNSPSAAASQGVLTAATATTTAQIIPASWRSAGLLIPSEARNPGYYLAVLPSEARNPAGASATTTPVPAPPPTQPWKSGTSAPRKPAEESGASAPDPNIWFATGGRAARVFHSPDRGATWQVVDTPILHGPDSAGIFSIAFLDQSHGVIAGGDYKHPDQDGPNLAFTSDGGNTWMLSAIYPQSFYSAATYDRRSTQSKSRLFIAGPKFIYDFRPPRNPTRISPPKKSGIGFNALSPYPQGGVIAVGPKGAIATVP
jgi:photosystem II stability/assembly factor-like uncharacterized protein